jgi:hypothetical protein
MQAAHPRLAMRVGYSRNVMSCQLNGRAAQVHFNFV